MKQTDTPAFRRWFRNSVVVNEDGSPMVVYHGTKSREPFSQFDLDATVEVGFHFGTKDQARDFSTVFSSDLEQEKKPRIYPVYLSIQKPFCMEDVFDGSGDTMRYTVLKGERLHKKRGLGDQISGWCPPGVIEENIARLRDELDRRDLDRRDLGWYELREILSSMGYDGIVYHNEHEGRPDRADNVAWIVWNPTQIKSAIGNRGTFDPDDPVITNPAEYRGSHTAPDKSSGAPLHDVTSVYPEDVYSSKGVVYYGHYGDHRDAEAISIIQRFRGKPDRMLRVYRAVPRNVTKINPGDWVTTVRSYAKEHGESSLGGDYRILSKAVRVRDLFTSGDSPFEWGYDPQPYVPKSKRMITNPVLPPELGRLIEVGDTVLNYDSAQGEDFYDLYDLVYTRRRPTTGEIEEVAGMLNDNGVFAVLSGDTRDLGKYFQKVGVLGTVAVAQGPKNPEVSRINAEKKRRKM